MAVMAVTARRELRWWRRRGATAMARRTKTGAGSARGARAGKGWEILASTVVLVVA